MYLLIGPRVRNGDTTALVDFSECIENVSKLVDRDERWGEFAVIDSRVGETKTMEMRTRNERRQKFLLSDTALASNWGWSWSRLGVLGGRQLVDRDFIPIST
jgi:hypothetical protein